MGLGSRDQKGTGSRIHVLVGIDFSPQPFYVQIRFGSTNRWFLEHSSSFKIAKFGFKPKTSVPYRHGTDLKNKIRLFRTSSFLDVCSWVDSDQVSEKTIPIAVTSWTKYERFTGLVPLHFEHEFQVLLRLSLRKDSYRIMLTAKIQQPMLQIHLTTFVLSLMALDPLRCHSISTVLDRSLF